MTLESSEQEVIATGDDHGLVKVYRNPCQDEVAARSYRGHSEHVTCVKFLGTAGEFMLSCGGQDQTVI